MPRIVPALVIAAAVCAASPAFVAQDPHADAWARLAEFTRGRMREANTPGMAVAVTSRDRLLHVGAFGYANLAAGRPIAADTPFEIGSISKSFTAIALLQLQQEGRFDPRAPIARYLPWFKLASSYPPLTGHHLLTHTAGLPRDRDDIPSSRYQAYAVREREAAYRPGDRFAYSNVGYQVLGYALESIDKRAYADAIQARILDPLGMTATVAQITHDLRPKLAVGYQRLYDDRPSHPAHPLVPATWLEYGAGDGSIVSTAADMASYARMLLNRGVVSNGTRVLAEAGFAALTQRAVSAGDQTWYGYGIFTSERDGRVVLSHNGTMVGYAATVAADAEAGVAAVAFANGPGDPARVARFAVDVGRAALRQEALPDLPEPTDPAVIENASDYTGTYTSGSRTLVLKADPPLLGVPVGRQLMLLEERDRDVFYLNDPAWYTFLLRFERDSGVVSGFSHGPDWYTRSGHQVPTTVRYPQEWNAYSGHYRTTHAWFNNFRIVIRRGTLLLVAPSGSEMAMDPIGPGLFRDTRASSERLRFDSIVEGQALRANLSGVDYYRVFTP